MELSKQAIEELCIVLVNKIDTSEFHNEICLDDNFDGVHYFVTGHIHISTKEVVLTSDEYGRPEMGSEIIDFTPFLVVTSFDENNDEVFYDTTDLEIELTKMFK